MVTSSLLSHIVQPLSLSHTGQAALDHMNEYHVKQLPVINDGALLGLVHYDDIVDHDLSVSLSALNLPFDKISLSDNDHLYEAIKIIGERRLTALPVVNSEEQYLGVVTQEDLLSFFANMGSFAEPGSIIVIETGKRDYSLADISRIVESENAAILSTFITTSAESEQVDVTLKINRQKVDNILAALERYEYKIKASFQEIEYFDALKERYDALMTYLNV